MDCQSVQHVNYQLIPINSHYSGEVAQSALFYPILYSFTISVSAILLLLSKTLELIQHVSLCFSLGLTHFLFLTDGSNTEV